MYSTVRGPYNTEMGVIDEYGAIMESRISSERTPLQCHTALYEHRMKSTRIDAEAQQCEAVV
jgi:hypothetical protein